MEVTQDAFLKSFTSLNTLQKPEAFWKLYSDFFENQGQMTPENVKEKATEFLQGTGIGGKVNKLGTGTVIFTGANTYTGATTISSGTLQIGNAGTTGSIAGPRWESPCWVWLPARRWAARPPGWAR